MTSYFHHHSNRTTPLLCPNCDYKEFFQFFLFQSKHSWLSNLYPTPCKLDGFTYPSVEHGYVHQAALAASQPDVARRARTTTCPYQVNRLLKDLPTVLKWQHTTRYTTLAALQLSKFTLSSTLREKLKDTGPNTPLYESTRNPTFGTGYVLKDGAKNLSPQV